jgi:hypothetical protein
MVNADAQDLGVQSRKTGRVGLVGRDLARSDGCPGHRVEYQYDVLAAVVAKRNIFIQVGWQGEIGRHLPYDELHGHTSGCDDLYFTLKMTDCFGEEHPSQGHLFF